MSKYQAKIMKNKKQISIDWFINHLIKCGHNLSAHKLEIQQAKQMHKEEIKNAQMDMYNHVNDLPYGLSYFAQLQKAEEFADNYCNETFGGDNEII